MVGRYSNTYLYMLWSDFYGYKRLKSRSVQEIRGDKETDKEVGGFMTREEIIDGLQYTIDMFCFNPSTGEVTGKNRLNDESRLTVDACEGAIEIIKALEQQPCGNAIDRAEAIKIASGYCHPANVAKELAKLPSVNLMPCEDAISREDALMCLTGEIKETDTIEIIIARFARRIRKLPPVNPQPCEDAISRQAVQDYIAKYLSQYLYNDVREAVEAIDEYVGELPSVNPQCGDAIDRKLVCAFIDGLISDDSEREKGLEYIRNMPPVNPQPCEDSISRQAAIDEIRKCRFVVDAIEKIRGLPPVTPHPKTGHWIFDDECKEHGHCSRCGYGSVDLVDGESHYFCRNCGARMIEPQESEDKE